MNVAGLSDRSLERFGEYTSLVFNGREYTNAEQHSRGARLAGALTDLGIGVGDRVGVMLPNSPDVGTAYQATLRIGAVAMPLLFLLAPAELHYILRDSGASAIVTHAMFYPKVAEALQGLEDPPMVVIAGEQVADLPTFDGLLARAHEPHPIVERAPDDVAVISYTSGTTGTPKGVMLTHGNLLFNAENTARVAPLRDGDVPIGCLPLAHLFGIGAALVAGLFKIKNVLLEWFTAEGVFDAVNVHRATSAAMVPTMLQYLLTHPQFDAVDWSSLQWVVVGAAPVTLEVAEEFERRTGARILEGYGLTETSPTAALTRLEDDRRPGSCGRPVPNVEITILDDDDKPLPPGEQGEVCIRGPNVMKGYYNSPDATAEAIRDGWFHSGDIGYLDADGFLYITDRKKDLIIRGGLNVYPRDVEEVLYQHPAVEEAAVVGLPDQTMGEQVRAYVVLRDGARADVDDILTHCRARLATYKTPSSIVFADSLPKNAIGKILKKELRALASSGEPSAL